MVLSGEEAARRVDLPQTSYCSGRFAAGLLLILLLVLAWSGIHPRDRFTWVLEVAPAVVAIVVLAGTWRYFRFTTLVCVLICIHGSILCVGGHYTYAEVPLFNWIRDTCGLARNDYDRIGHFAQGFVPAMIARELLLRTSPLRRGGWLTTLVLCVCLAISAAYELVEWGVAQATGTAADAFLGTQGDPWDTQWDMFTALIGAVAALLTLSRLQDRALAASSPQPCGAAPAPAGGGTPRA